MKLLLISLISIFLLFLFWLMAPPEVTMQYRKTPPYQLLSRGYLRRERGELTTGGGRNIFAGKEKPVQVIKQPGAIVKVIPKKIDPPVKKEVLQSRNLRLLGYQEGRSSEDDLVFIHDGKSIHYMKRGERLLERWRLETIDTNSVILYDEIRRRREKVRSGS
jgi:hypothetical protein